MERTFVGAVGGQPPSNLVFVIVRNDEELREKLEEIFSGLENGDPGGVAAGLMNGADLNGDLSSPDHHVDPLLAASPDHSAAAAAGDSIA